MADSREGRRTCDVVIVGGGIIGLAAGRRLLHAGLSVTVVERSRAGAAASSAAAGMLAPDAEAGAEAGGLRDLTRAGLAMWPDFAAALEAETGVAVELRTDGILIAAPGPEEAASLKTRADASGGADLPAQWISAAEACDLEPALTADLEGALFLPGDGHVNNRLAVSALVRAFRAAGGVLLEATPVLGLVERNGRAEGVLTDAGPVAAGVVILAAGAWAGALPGWPSAALPPVRPVKGQMAALRPRRTMPGRVIWGGAKGPYLVPRADGRVLVGATVEEAGFDMRLTASGLNALLSSAIAVVPALADAELTDHWAGLRPGTPDDIPVVGRAPMEGVVWAAGHHRNGILLAPLTADAVCRLVMKEDRPWPQIVMDPERQAVKGVRGKGQGRADAT